MRRVSRRFRNGCFARRAYDGSIHAETAGGLNGKAINKCGQGEEARPSSGEPHSCRRGLSTNRGRQRPGNNVPETLSEFAAQLSASFKEAYPAGPAVAEEFVEEAIRDTWHRRHEVIGSEL